MPRVLKHRVVAPQGPPPAGLVAVCYECGAELETSSNEPTAQATVLKFRKVDLFGKNRQTRKPGWFITCPECGCTDVFFAQ